MNFSEILSRLLKLFFITFCFAHFAFLTFLTIDEFKKLSADPIVKRIFLINKTIDFTLLLVCSTAGLLNCSFFLQSSSCVLAFNWLQQHYKNPSLLWTGDTKQISFHVLLLTIIICAQLLAFTLSSSGKVEFIPYRPNKSSDLNSLSFKRKVQRSGSGSSYLNINRNINGNSNTVLWIVINEFALHNYYVFQPTFFATSENLKYFIISPINVTFIKKK
jgi:hypothetical protein